MEIKNRPGYVGTDLNKEFSHVNGPKDQAGGCLADLLFCFINIQISIIQKICRYFIRWIFIQINLPSFVIPASAQPMT